MTAPLSVHIPAHLLWMKHVKLCVCLCVNGSESQGCTLRVRETKGRDVCRDPFRINATTAAARSVMKTPPWIEKKDQPLFHHVGSHS